jgi:glycosyltransferase involved in cell wall biosynthesis
MRQRILVDLLAYTGERGGTETYVREITMRLPANLPDTEFVAVANRAGGARVREFFPGEVRVARFVGADRVTWAAAEVFALELFARRTKSTVIWNPANFGPVTRGVARVTTVHDLIYHVRGGALPTRLVRSATAWLMSRAALSADTVITGSQAAKRAIVTQIGVSEDRIRVIPHGTNDPLAVKDASSTLDRLGLPVGRQVVLSTGNRLPHKNFEGLLRAIRHIPEAHRPVTVIPGGRGDDPLRALVTEFDLERDVLLPGWVSVDELEALYAQADLYVCPSLMEGFGLPVVDAMRRGCVVLANDIEVLREVGGDAALYADARNPRSFADAIASALSALPDASRRARAMEWSRRFTWDESAARTAEVLAEAARVVRRRRNDFAH